MSHDASHAPQSPITLLARQQLAAYNAADLDAFADCYHPQVRVYEGDECTIEGRAALRERYAPMFAAGGFGASVPERLSQGMHCVDRELWWRVDPDTGDQREGALLVRYTERDGLIGVVQFLYDEAEAAREDAEDAEDAEASEGSHA